MTNQPVWKFLDNFGDANPIDHGGFFIFEDTTGVYAPQAEVLEFDEYYEKTEDDDFDHIEDDEDFDEQEDNFGKWTVHRFDLTKCTLTNGILSDNSSHPEYEVWWHNHDAEHKARHGYDEYSNFCKIAEESGMTPEELEEMFCSDDILIRAQAYRMLLGQHGIQNFDQYPVEFTSRKEIEARYEPYGF